MPQYLNTKSNFFKRATPFLLIVLVFVSRLPLIFGPYFQADGDESIVGLMAKELSENGIFRIYFWGQQYGLVSIETSTAALAFKLFGVNVFALKLSMLLLWAVGVCYLFYAVKNFFNEKIAWVFVLLLILSPVWGLWSMKARGGYITAILFSAFAAWLASIINLNPGKKLYFYWAFIGLSLTIIFYSQKLWLIGGLPLLLLFLFRRANILKANIMICSAIAFVVLISFLARHENGSFSFPIQEYKVYFNHSPIEIFNTLSFFFRGAYYLNLVFSAGILNTITGYIWACIFALMMLVQIIRLAVGKFYRTSHILFFSCILPLFVIFMGRDKEIEYRYLLPVAVPLILLFVIELFYWANYLNLNHILKYFWAGFIILNCSALYQLRNVPIEKLHEPSASSFNFEMNSVVKYLKINNIHSVFTTHNMLLWQIDFYSNGEIFARNQEGKNRNMNYICQVTDDYLAGKPSALVENIDTGDLDPLNPGKGINAEKIMTFGNQFRVYINPTNETLLNLGFDMQSYSFH